MIFPTNLHDFSPPPRFDETDAIEADPSKPGKVLNVNDDDTDGDGIPDYADGYALNGTTGMSSTASEQFVPVIVEVPKDLDLSVADFRFTYDVSDPRSVTASGTPTKYSLPSGSLRLWTRDGSVPRDGRSFDSVGTINPNDNKGYFVNSQAYSGSSGDWNKLAAACGKPAGTRVLTLYVEAVKASTGLADKSIKLDLNPDGAGAATWLGSDTVLMTVSPGLMRADGNRDGTITFNTTDSTKLDTTSQKAPYRFWLNDDFDYEDTKQLLTERAPVNGSSNFKTRGIDNTRDLEDFSRLDIKWPTGIQALRTDDVVELTISNMSSPQDIRLYSLQGTSTNFTYLTDTSVAAAAKNSQWIQPTTLSTGDVVWLVSASKFNAANIASFLFEANKETSAKVTIEFRHSDQNATLYATDSTWLDFKPIQKLYEIWTVGTAGNPFGDSPTMVANPREVGTTAAPVVPWSSAFTSVGDPASITSAQRDLYSKDYVLYVHGWNNTPAQRRQQAATAYKRLWWQGFKGRFGLFSWPTNWGNFSEDPTSLLKDAASIRNFDESEMKSFASAQALLGLFKKLGTGAGGDGYSVNVYAHSHGNIAVSEALRLEAISSDTNKQIVHTYVATQAASPASAYDPAVMNNPANHLGERYYFSFPVKGPDGEMYRLGAGLGVLTSSTPDIYTNLPGWNQAYFQTINLASQKNYNFFNPNDGAVGKFYIWPLDEALKPDSGYVWSTARHSHLNYSYVNGTFFEQASHLDRFTNPFTGDVQDSEIVEWPKTLNIGLVQGTSGAFSVPYDGYAAMSFAAEAKSTGLGATAGVGGAFTMAGQVNVQTAFGLSGSTSNFTSSVNDHGGQFELDLAQRYQYWNLLLQRFLGTDKVNNPITPTAGIPGGRP